MIRTRIQAGHQATLAVLSVSLLAAFAGCGNLGEGDPTIGSTQSALAMCVPGAPVVTQVREETPGPVAPGVTKIYFVTVQNTSSAACGPATLTFVPDSFHLFSAVAQPSSIGGVASGATATFRVAVTSDPSVPEGSTTIGFTVVANPGSSTRGSLVYTVSLTNPVGCNRQPPQIDIPLSSPPPVPSGTTVSYQITVRDIDNGACGADSFSITPFSAHLWTITVNGPFTIAPGGSATFTLTITPAVTFPSGFIFDESFTVIGAHHGSLTNTGTVRYTVK